MVRESSDLRVVPELFYEGLTTGKFCQLGAWMYDCQTELIDGAVRVQGQGLVIQRIRSWSTALEPRQIARFEAVTDELACVIDITLQGRFVRPYAGIFPLGAELSYSCIWTIKPGPDQHLRIWSDANLWQWFRATHICGDEAGAAGGPARGRYRILNPGERELDLSHVERTVWASQLQLPPYLARLGAGWVAGMDDEQLAAVLSVSSSTLRSYGRSLHTHLRVHSRSEAISALMQAAAQSCVPVADCCI